MPSPCRPTIQHWGVTWRPSVGSRSWLRGPGHPASGWTRWSLHELGRDWPVWLWAPWVRCTDPTGPAAHVPDTCRRNTKEMRRKAMTTVLPRAEESSRTEETHWWAPSPQHACYSPQVWEQGSLGHKAPGIKENMNSALCFFTNPKDNS